MRIVSSLRALLPSRLPIPLSKGRATLSVRQWFRNVPEAIVANLVFRAACIFGLFRAESIPIFIESYLREKIWTGALDPIPFSHRDYRDLRALLRLGLSGHPDLALAIYVAHRKEQTRRHRHWAASHMASAMARNRASASASDSSLAQVPDIED